jgi:hypothetical protein
MSKNDSGVDIRKPSLMDREASNSMLEGLDRGLPPVTNWKQFHTWLGRGTGWAYFTRTSAKELLPHWFIDTEYRYQQRKANGYRSGPFFDVDAFSDGNVRLGSADEMFGPDAEEYGETQRGFEQLADNFIITRKRLFVL